MNIFRELLWTICNYNFTLFSNIRVILIVYSLIFIILFLENAIIPAVFLPGDSLLIILGILIGKGCLNFFITLFILTIAASLGTWISYLQGKFLERNKTVRRWLSRFPNKFYQKIVFMLNKHGLYALFFGRFIAFARTVLPIIAGVYRLNSLRFQIFNWISSFLWVFILIVLGVLVERTKFLDILCYFNL